MKNADFVPNKSSDSRARLFSAGGSRTSERRPSSSGMVPVIRDLLDEIFTGAFKERPPDFAPWFFEYFALENKPVELKRFARAIAADLALAGADLRGRVVVDAGSGFGIQLLCLGCLGARQAIGLEVFGPMVVTAKRLASRYAPWIPAHFPQSSVSEIPLRDESVDFIYCNEALSHFGEPPSFLQEASRILRPGGRLMICDANNAANPAIVRRTHAIWRAFEEGPPTDNIFGHAVKYSYRERRRQILAERWPAVEEPVRERLVWGTFGLHGESMMKRAEEMLASGIMPESPLPLDRVPIDPDKGDCIENLIHPHALEHELRNLGFAVKVYAHFGGSRSPLYAVANRILRAFTPLTLRRALAFKIVATKKQAPAG